MKSDDLNKVLASIDRPAAPAEEAKARVWGRVRHDLDFPERQLPAASLPMSDGTVFTIEPVLEDETRVKSRRWHRFTLAAAIALVIMIVAVFDPPDQQVQVASDLTSAIPTTSLPTLNDPQAACARFVTGAGPLLDLRDGVDDTAEGTATLRAAAAALDQLLVDFNASPRPDPSTLTDIAQVAGGLRQAADHLSNGDQSQARDAIDFAERTYADSPLAATDCLE